MPDPAFGPGLRVGLPKPLRMDQSATVGRATNPKTIRGSPNAAATFAFALAFSRTGPTGVWLRADLQTRGSLPECPHRAVRHAALFSGLSSASPRPLVAGWVVGGPVTWHRRPDPSGSKSVVRLGGLLRKT